MNDRQKRDLGELILKSLSGNASDQEVRQLGEVILNDPLTMEYYKDYINLYACLLSPGSSSNAFQQDIEFDFTESVSSGSKVADSSNVSLRGVDLDKFMADAHDGYKTKDLLEIIELVRTSPAIEIENLKPVKPKPEIRKVGESTFKWFPGEGNKKLMRAYLALVASIMVFVGYIYFFVPDSVDLPIVARLDNSVDAVWDDELTEPGEYGYMVQSRYRLEKGYASIVFNDGANVTVEGPAELSLMSGGDMELFGGKIFAIVPERAKGFTVKAGDNKIVDLGTEFGVEVDDHGNTQLHVTKGRTVLFAGMQTGKKSEVNVNAGEAKKVYKDGFVKDLPGVKNKFVRKINSGKASVRRVQIDISNATPVAITNPGFEDGTTGWSMEVKHIRTLPYPLDGFEYTAPEGSNVFFAWGANQNALQVLSETLKANTRYVLQMDFCVRSDDEGPIRSMLALGYGSSGPDGGGILKKIVTGEPGTTIPSRGMYETWTLVYETGDLPVGAGEPLWIQLGTKNIRTVNSSSAYDNVRLYTAPVSDDMSR